MSKQTLVFTSPTALSIKNGLLQIKVENEDNLTLKSFEDIRMILIDHISVSLTVPLINRLADNNIAVVFCNEQHMPNTMLMDLTSNSMQTKYIRGQIEASKPLNKALWKQIIETKIKNQSNLLYKLGLGNNLLKAYYDNVKSGDTTNREGIAAKAYWKHLFGKNFIRDRYGLPPNNLLNYGYAILRSAIARALMNSGLMPGIGIFHKNYYDSFPLADDIMEPYRPFIDEIVYDAFNRGIVDIDNKFKHTVLSLFYDVITYEILASTTRSFAMVYCDKGHYLQYINIE